MSRIDENNDDQRIREMQQSELRARKEQDAKDASTRVSKSFQDVMRDKSTKPADDAREKKAADAKASEKERAFKETLLKKLPKSGAELSRRAALSRATQQGMTTARTSEQQKLREADADRATDLTKKVDDEKERLEKDVREADDATFRTEEKGEIFKKVDPDAENREGGQSRDKGSRRDDGGEQQGRERKPENVATAAPTHASSPTARTIPPEILEKLVGAIYQASRADGRTEMLVELKGGMLEGVSLKVTSENGKVQCAFEGCDKQLKNLLESSKGALMRGLSKRGLTLTSLKAS